MDYISELQDFINTAEKNRKYPANTAHGRRAALKLFDTVLHPDERESLDLIEERMDEIFLSLIAKHKDAFSIQSLTTYKGRFLKAIQDYKRYGANPEKITHWDAKLRPYVQKNKDSKKDTSFHSLSSATHMGVHKLEIATENGSAMRAEIPNDITSRDITRIKNILDGLGKEVQ